MFLKSIEIHGFKSFANKTLLEFLPPKQGKNSITAVVGPNGSGKSNISDAIRWVMGEQSMKMLRGKKSADIIFAGSESKGQMSMASVSLTIDNSDGRAPIEYEELVLTRRLYRSGDSEYLVNGNPVRLLDIQLLLAKAQFGQGSYAIIGQGMIDRLLLHSAEERKTFFDEAAGIKEFQIKRHQAWLKLERSREHIAQADMLLNEISPRLKTLSRQVKKLEERQAVETELREKQEMYYTTVWRHNDSERRSLLADLDALSTLYTTVQERLATIQTELAELARQESRQDVFEALQKEFQDITRQKNVLEREKAVLTGKLQTEYSRVGKQNIGWLENKIEEVGNQQSGLQQDIDAVERLVSELEKKMYEQKRQIDDAQIEKTQLRGKIAQLQQQVSEKKHEESVWQVTGLRAVQAVLTERHRLGEIYGAVAQLGTVQPEYQLALDVAAASHLSSVVVASDSVAESCIHYLRQEQLGVATFLPVNKIRGRFLPNDIHSLLHETGVCGLAIDLVKFDQQFADIFSYVLGSTLIVEDITAARRIGVGRVRMVTKDGDVLETSGSMKGGFRRTGVRGLSFGNNASWQSAGSSQPEEEMDQLQKRLEQIEIALEQAQSVFRDLQSEINVAGGKLSFLQSKKQELDRERAGLDQELSLHSMSPEEYDTVMKTLAAEKVVIDTDITKLDEQLMGVQKKIARFNDDEEQKKQRVFALQDAMQTEQQELNQLSEKKNILQVDIAKRETKLEDVEHEAYQELKTSIHSVVERVLAPVLIAEIEVIGQEIEKLKYKLSLIGGIDEEVITEYEETKARHEELMTQLTDLSKAAEDLETLIEELDGTMKKRRDKAFKEIRREFKNYFEVLFEGGEADLIEVYGNEAESGTNEENLGTNDANEAHVSEVELIDDESISSGNKKKRTKKLLQGIDIKACPPGKKIKNLQALSGGERTMTSIALVCAILKTNPPPFVILDEVEAALDEANTLRLTNILHELSFQSQFVLVTHNRATMHAADVLYGVTMGNDGISHLLSVKLEEAERVVE